MSPTTSRFAVAWVNWKRPVERLMKLIEAGMFLVYDFQPAIPTKKSDFRLNHVCGHHPKEQRLVYACDVSWVLPSYLSMSNVDGLPCIGCLLLGAFGQMKQHSQTRKRK